MNNIEEFVEIIKEYKGEATFLDICNKYQEKHKRSLSQSQRIAIANTLNNYPNKIYLDPLTKKWKIVVPNKGIKVKIPSINNDNRIIICRVAYMRHYKGIINGDNPKNGGAYVAETGDAEEKYNYLNIDGECYGFIETKHAKDGSNKKLALENIDKSYKDADIANNIKVVFVALNPFSKKTVVVGWYDNASVYRERQYHTVNGNEHQFNLKCKFEDAHLIEDGRRTFEVPNAAKVGNEYGIGQSNVWYIHKNEKAREFELELLRYLREIVL